MEPKLASPFIFQSSWMNILEDELQKDYIQELAAFVQEERTSGKEVYPPEGLVFSALNETPFDDVRVVIMGQDPYHGPGQAHGLSFSVPEGVRPPPSLQNIFKELQSDLGVPIPNHGCLLHWARQGVLLLNATLTVRRGEPLSHHNRGWERFTDAVIRTLASRVKPAIFVLWGRSAKEKVAHIPLRNHVVLQAAHPSPFSAHSGFFGCGHFRKINNQLEGWGQPPIDWDLTKS